MIQNQEGQALVETTVVISAMFLLTKFIIVLFVIIFSSIWIQHSLYQALICLAEGRSQSYCEKNLTSSINNILPFGQTQDIKWIRNAREWKGSLNWQFYNKNWNFKQEFILP